MYHSVGLSFSKLSFKLASVYVYVLPQSSDLFAKSSDMINKNALGVKIARSIKADLPMCNQKL